MIDLHAGPGGTLRITVDPRVVQRRIARSAASRRIIDAVARGLPAGALAAPSERLAELPHAHGLLAFGAGHVDSRRGELLLARLVGIDEQVLRRMDAGRISLLQDESLLPTSETRSAAVVLAPEADGLEPGALDAAIDRIAGSSGPAWTEFVGIVKVITFVGVVGRPDLPFFSGSTSDFWGAVHLAWARSDSVLAECLTHEAAHLWLMLAEEVQPLCEEAWDGRHWDSPWRDDPRPLGGIVHGAFVFSCASLVLASMVRDGLAGPEATDRIARITAQVEAAVLECRGSGALSPLGESVVESALARIAVSRRSVPAPLIRAAAARVLDEQDAKRARRRATSRSARHA